MSQGFSWASAARNAFSSFESSSGLQPQAQPPITLPQSTYDPSFTATSIFDFGVMLNDQGPTPPNDHVCYSPVRTAMSYNVDHEQQQRELWGGFALNQGFSTHPQGTGGYSGPAVYDDQDMSVQYLRLPSRNAFPIVPIYENTPPFNSATAGPASLTQADILRSSNPNLYPHNAMPLTIKHPEFKQQEVQQTTISEDAWAAHLMSDVERLEHSSQVSVNTHQPPLTISQLQSSSPPQQMEQPQYTVEQIEHALLYQSANSNHPNDIAKLYEQLTANIHDEVAASRLNNGNKEIATMPSAIPSVPSLLVRYPTSAASSQRFAQNHPYTSPRFSAQSLGGGRAGGAGARSMRPVVPRITVKRESLSVPAPMTTAYLAGLRRHVPLAELASERAPVEPYGHSRSLSYPHPIAVTGSASTATSSLPPESPFSATLAMHPSANGTMPEGYPWSRSHPGSMSPKKEQGLLAEGGGSLRLNRGQERPSTGASSNSGGMLSPQMSSIDRQQLQQPQARATAARKRADDDILQHSFRSESDWRRRMVLESVLSSTFVAENTLEPVCGGMAGASAGDVTNSAANAESMAGLGLDAGLGSPGKSVYAVFLEQVEKSEWRCLFGDREHPCPSQAVAFRRLERALDHVRSHLNHRPFACKGECQKGDSCDARFFARSHLQDHVKRTESACCETCGQVIRIQNMPRHRMAH